jgi:hypothetical protein
MWADIAGIKDITAPGIHSALFQSKVLNEWDALRERIGYEVDIV